MRKYFVVSDIHAKYEMLLKALLAKGFEIENEEHILIIGGDVLDRGSEGLDVILFIQDLILQERVLGVVGNHDDFIIDWLSGNVDNVYFNIRYNGFGNTVDLARGMDDWGNYSKIKDIAALGQDFRKRYPVFCDWLEDLPLYREFEKHILVHGALNFGIKSWRNTGKNFAIWERQSRVQAPPKNFSKRILVGHTPTIIQEGDIITGGDPVEFDKFTQIDGGAAYGGQMNVLVFKEGEL